VAGVGGRGLVADAVTGQAAVVVAAARGHPGKVVRQGEQPVGLEYTDVACDQLFFAVAHCCQAATWYSFMRPPTICFRRTRCSARSICSGQA
jgi:hypothetical protein